MLVVKYTPPASAQSGETLDVTDYVIRAVWSGDAEQAPASWNWKLHIILLKRIKLFRIWICGWAAK